MNKLIREPFVRVAEISLILIVAITSSSAVAATVNFRDAAWNDANFKESSFEVIDGIKVTAEADPDLATLYQDTKDGLGVRKSYEVDEIEGPERLIISFDTAVFLEEMLITDLFKENGYLEMGSYWFNGDDTNTYDLLALDPRADNGELLLAGLWDGIQINSITFSAPGRFDGQNHEFSVGQLIVSQVPLPAAVWLFGSALAGFGLMKFRRSKQALVA